MEGNTVGQNTSTQLAQAGRLSSDLVSVNLERRNQSQCHLTRKSSKPVPQVVPCRETFRTRWKQFVVRDTAKGHQFGSRGVRIYDDTPRHAGRYPTTGPVPGPPVFKASSSLRLQIRSVDGMSA